MSAFDHRYFPHIIDAIWDAMPVGSVLRARRVSRGWLRRANRILQRHVVADPVGELDGFQRDGVRFAAVNTDTMEPFPRGLVWYVPQIVIDSMSNPLHCSTPLPAYNPRPLPPDLEELFQNIVCIDVHADSLQWWHGNRTAVSMCVNALIDCYRLPVLRLRTADPLPEPPTAVYSDFGPGITSPGLFRARTFVLHLNFLPGEIGWEQIFWEQIHDDLRSLIIEQGTRFLDSRVVLFHPEPFLDRIDGSGRELCPGFVEALHSLCLLCWMRPFPQLNLVGMEAFFADTGAFETFKADVIDLVRNTGGPVEGREKSIRVLTSAEYAELVGQETYQLHTAL